MSASNETVQGNDESHAPAETLSDEIKRLAKTGNRDLSDAGQRFLESLNSDAIDLSEFRGKAICLFADAPSDDPCHFTVTCSLPESSENDVVLLPGADMVPNEAEDNVAANNV